MVQRTRPSKFSERRGDFASELRDALHRELRAAESLDLVSRITPGVRRLRTYEEPGALAIGCDCRVGAGHGGRVLEHNAHHADFGADFAARRVGGIFQTILMFTLLPGVTIRARRHENHCAGGWVAVVGIRAHASGANGRDSSL